MMVCQVAPALGDGGALIGLRWLIRDLKALRQACEPLERQVSDLRMELTQAQGVLESLRKQVALRERELHHRVRNHLQIVASLLNGTGHDLHDPQAQTTLQACQTRLRTVALLHELLSRAVKGEILALGPYLRLLALLLFEVYSVDRQRVPLTVEADTVEVVVQSALACGLLVHEVLSHRLSQAFQSDQAQIVAIMLRATPPGQVTLTIRDTGVGIPMDGQVREVQGLGSPLIRALTEQLQGTLVVMHEQGTRVILRFPMTTGAT